MFVGEEGESCVTKTKLNWFYLDVSVEKTFSIPKSPSEELIGENNVVGESISVAKWKPHVELLLLCLPN